jgi:hypothetical protein
MASPFNQKLTDEEKIKLEKGEVLIRNIAYPKNICLKSKGNVVVVLAPFSIVIPTIVKI